MLNMPQQTLIAYDIYTAIKVYLCKLERQKTDRQRDGEANRMKGFQLCCWSKKNVFGWSLYGTYSCIYNTHLFLFYFNTNENIFSVSILFTIFKELFNFYFYFLHIFILTLFLQRIFAVVLYLIFLIFSVFQSFVIIKNINLFFKCRNIRKVRSQDLIYGLFMLKLHSLSSYLNCFLFVNYWQKFQFSF